MNIFEWDETKRKVNHEKHGIDFIDAIRIFEDSDRIEIESIRDTEKRYKTLDVINGIIFLIVYTQEF